MRGATSRAARSPSRLQLFQSTHPMRGATEYPEGWKEVTEYFNPRTPCGVRQRKRRLVDPLQFISIHAPHAGCDAAGQLGLLSARLFQSTHPMRGATTRFLRLRLVPLRFQSTHPMRGATRKQQRRARLRKISIHAPHAGCDAGFRPFWPRQPVFQSTHPMRGATSKAGGRAGSHAISIHAPHAGCDLIVVILCQSTLIFQSTHPMRGATSSRNAQFSFSRISIHAPHAGCDHRLLLLMVVALAFQSTHPMRGATDGRAGDHLQKSYFNPRTPCGVRPYFEAHNMEWYPFQSTHPMRGATTFAGYSPKELDDFNPRTPCGVRHTIIRAWCSDTIISIHAPHAGCDKINGAYPPHTV